MILIKSIECTIVFKALNIAACFACSIRYFPHTFTV